MTVPPLVSVVIATHDCGAFIADDVESVLVQTFSDYEIIFIDDYHAWSGCRRAVNEYFSVVGRRGYEFREKHRLHIVKL